MVRARRAAAALLAASVAQAGAVGRVLNAEALVTHDDHIRTTDTTLRTALNDGLAHSATFQALVAKLEASDVVVFLVYDRKATNLLASHISFLSAAGGRRYLTIGLISRLPRVRQVAILAHELQHAVEIADAPAIVDSKSMAQYYAGLKYGGVVDPSPQHRFESRAAIDMEQRVAREMAPRHLLPGSVLEAAPAN
jgi:hypothetical protein